jgi:hypothetical protein
MTRTAIAQSSALVLAAYPTARGFAWVLFESPQQPVAWSLVHARAGRGDHLVRRFSRILDRYAPGTVVLEDYEDKNSRRSPRIRKLCEEMAHQAMIRDMETPVFDQEAVQMVFAKHGALTRASIAKVIADQIGDFRHRMPRPHQTGNSEDVRQSLFDAAALALTYFAYRGDIER